MNLASDMGFCAEYSSPLVYSLKPRLGMVCCPSGQPLGGRSLGLATLQAPLALGYSRDMARA